MKNYLTSDFKYKIITGPGEVYSFSDYSNDKNMDVIDLEILYNAIQEDFDETMDERGLAEYSDIEKVVSIPPPIPSDSNGKINYGSSAESDEPYLLWTVYTNSFLDRREEKELLDYIEGQCSDGWGEGFEQQVLYSYSDQEEEWVEDEDFETGEVEEYIDYVTSNFDVYYSPWVHGHNWKIEVLNKTDITESSKLKKNKDNNVIEIQEEITIDQADQKIILEPGDKIRVLKENTEKFWKDYF